MCALLGGGICLVQGGVLSLKPTMGLWVALISGLAQAAFSTTWLLAVRTGAYTMLDAFLTAGILIPTVFCRLFYQEPIFPLQWLGFAVLPGAVCLMCSYNNSIKKKLTVKSEFYGIGLVESEIDTESLGALLGKSGAVAAVGICDDAFASEIVKAKDSI